MKILIIFSLLFISGLSVFKIGEFKDKLWVMFLGLLFVMAGTVYIWYHIFKKI